MPLLPARAPQRGMPCHCRCPRFLQWAFTVAACPAMTVTRAHRHTANFPLAVLVLVTVATLRSSGSEAAVTGSDPSCVATSGGTLGSAFKRFSAVDVATSRKSCAAMRMSCLCAAFSTRTMSRAYRRRMVSLAATTRRATLMDCCAVDSSRRVASLTHLHTQASLISPAIPMETSPCNSLRLPVAVLARNISAMSKAIALHCTTPESLAHCCSSNKD